MNFACSSKDLDYSAFGLAKHSIINDWNLYLDRGWSRIENYFYKGLRSSWCKIYVDPVLRIETNKFRDFPIYYNKDTLSNFQKLEHAVPVDGLIEFDDEIKIRYQENFYPKIGKEFLSQQECHEILFDALIDNIGSIASKDNGTIYIPAQGGIDTLTIRSVFDYLKVEYKTFDMPTSPPVLSHLGSELAKNYWGFMQVQEKDNAVVVTGFYGDEWVLRNPYYAHVLLSSRNIDIVEEFDNVENCYMKIYFEKYRKKCSDKTDMTVNELMSQICNDFQIWHINDTKFFSPLKHESLLHLMAADTKTIIEQVTDAKLSKSIIERCNPELVKFIDKSKNQNDPDYFWP